MVRVPGSWKSLDDLEEHVTINELERMLTAARKIEHEARKFHAAIKGINLDENNASTSSFEEVQERARAKAAGKSPEELSLEEVGIAYAEE